MELLLKLPKGKPPFIGIGFTDSQGQKLNVDLVTQHYTLEYKLILEYIHGKLVLRLICEELVTVRFYTDLSFDADKLTSWLYITRNHNVFSFGHVSTINGRHVIVRTTHPNSVNFVLRVISVQLISTKEQSNPGEIRVSNRYWD